MGYERPWQVSDAPEQYVKIVKKNIIGVEIDIHRLQGKFKMSQKLGVGDREGVVEGFNKIGTDAAEFSAKTVQERGRIKDEEKKLKAEPVTQ
jgi:transcriptional regulator